MTSLRYCPLVALFAFMLPVGAEPPKLPSAASGKVNFDTDIKPILTANCFKCHGPEKQKGGLRLDSRKDALLGGNSGPVIVVGKSAESKLIHAVAGVDPDTKMPPGDKSLSSEQVGKLRAWIDQGADYGSAANDSATGPVKSSHWAFQAIRKFEVPASKFQGKNPIDQFVLVLLEKEGLTPASEADRTTLIRRVSLDLIGLPPSPAEVDAFLADRSPEAYEKVVDRLLASPHYGERWGRHWLDAARYADSDGYEKDTGRPFAWRYRDWVIKALNDDVPFDHFTIEQLAGDLLPTATVEQKIATGFHRNTLTNKEGGVDAEEFRVAACVDRVSTTSKVWLGLTVGCAQCHDHKYDPISQREFYQFFAFFNSDREVDLDAALPGEAEKMKAEQAVFETEKAKLQAAVNEAKEKKLPDTDLKKREAALAAHLKKAPSVSKAMTLAAGPAKSTNVMIRGDFLRKGVEVKPGTPGVLPSPPVATGGLSRLDLAKWLVAPDNPLTARVIVNWTWAKYFGRGIVATPEDFGTQGEKPSHPELLDWLASEFKAQWSMKKLHRLIVTSATYRQSSATRTELSKRDPLNVLLARQSRLRLEAEIVRDNALTASGLLNRTIGGPSIRPPQPAGISELTYANSVKWVETTGPDRYKRGLYVWFQRTSPYPMLMAFDTPDSNVCTVRRERSNTPLQALTLLNDAVFVECAQALAKRVLIDKKDATDAERVAYMMRLCVGRQVSKDERDRLHLLLADFLKLAAKDPAAAAKLLGNHKPEGIPPAEAAAWVALARTILNLDEFVTRE
jgi:mono/diheme cytochrome c family protein